MFRAAVLAVLLSASASAQDLSRAQRLAVLGGGVAGGVGLTALVMPTAATRLGVVATAIALPVGTALGTHIVGRWVGADAPLGPTLLRTTAGSLAGLGATVAVWTAATRTADAVLDDYACEPICWWHAAAIGTGVVLVVGTPAVFATHGLEAQPVAFTAPTGETAAGFAFRVGL